MSPSLSTVRTLSRDVRALGKWAPARLLYEGLKYSGAHAAVFTRLRSTPRPLQRTALGAASPPPTRVAAQSERLESILAGTVELFEQDISVGNPPQWHSRIESDDQWPREPWWDLKVRAGDSPTDPKWTWELGRIEHIVVLARGAAAGDTAALETLGNHIRSWLDENPNEIGFHWYSNLEIAIRMVRWIEVIAVAGDLLEPDLVAKLEARCAHAVQHLTVDLPYTVSSMRNNHLLGDALGVIVVESSIRREQPRRVFTAAQRVFDNQTERQVRPDGSMIEGSICYHRFVIDMLAVRLILDPENRVARTALLNASQFLCRLGVFDGPVPEIGDWDGGRMLVATGDRHDLRGATALGLALCGTGATEAWRADFDECAYYVGAGTPVEPEAAECDGHDVGGGIARSRRGPFTTFLRFGSAPSHQHADLGSIVIMHEGEPLVIDPGTGTYNGDPEIRDHFRATSSHAALELDGTDQLVPTRTFRYGNIAGGAVGEPVVLADDTVVSWGAHDAYRRLQGEPVVVRAVVTSPGYVVAIDFVIEDGSQTAMSQKARLPLHPAIRVNGDVEAPTLEAFQIVSSQPVRREPARISRTLADVETTTALVATGDTATPIAFGLAKPGHAPTIEVDQTAVVCGSVTLTAEVRGTTAKLTVSQDGASFERSIETSGKNWFTSQPV